LKRVNYRILKNLHIKKWSRKSIKVESWRSFIEEMNVLGIQDSDEFQIQLVEYGKERKKKSSFKNNRRK